MNWKNTISLAVLVVAGAVGWLLLSLRQVQPPQSDSLLVLEHEITPEKLTHIEISRGDRHVRLDRRAGQEWSLPGNWPVREPEVRQLVKLLCGLRTRFAPELLAEPPDLKPYGLAQDALQVKVRTAVKEHTLTFGEAPGETSRFSQPTYVRVDNYAEVVRLAPGLIGELDRPQDYYMQRRLFPVERVAKDGEKVEQLAANAIAFVGPRESYNLVRSGADWELREPFRDRADPDKLQKLLTATPDIWAEEFVDKKDKKLDDFGLTLPEDKLEVALAGGGKVTLLVGKQSSVKVRQVTKPAPPFGPPRPPQVEMVHDEYRFAKLADNNRVFTIKADKLKDVAVAAADLRDPKLARFRSEDARRLEIKRPAGGPSLAGEENKAGLAAVATKPAPSAGKDEKHGPAPVAEQRQAADIVLVKEKDQWRLQKPKMVDAETSKVTEMLDKLSGLEATGADVIEKGDSKAYGLDKPVVLEVSVEETKGSDEKKTVNKRTFTFNIGKHDKAKKKLYVQVAGWPRINAVDDNLEKLIERPALAYRSRRVLDYPTADLARIEIQRPDETFALEQVKDTWRLATPVHAEVDAAKAEDLARDLARLEAVEFVTDQPKAEDLDKTYGLAKPELSAKLIFTDGKKPAQTVLIGKERKDKEYFAKLESDPAVFVIKKDVREAVDRKSLAYRSPDLWKIPDADIAELRVHKPEADYRLKREGSAWKIGGPFDAAAAPDLVKPMTEAVADLRAERYVAHTASDLKTYGLDKPYLRLAVLPQLKKEESKKEAKDKASETKENKEHVLLVGGLVGKDGKDAKARYARLGNGEAIFILPEKTVTALDHRALDFLDRTLFSASFDAIGRISRKSEAGNWTLQHEKDKWWLTDSPVTPFVADEREAAATVGAIANLRARELAAYGPNVDLSSFGLDKPAVTISFTVKSPADKDKAGKEQSHSLALGKPVGKDGTERYARLDQGPAVAVLDSATLKEITRNYLEFVNHDVFKFSTERVNDFQRQMNSAFLEIAKKNNQWRLVKPADAPADQPTLDALVRELSTLRAQRIAAFPAKDAKERARFGLDVPAALVIVRIGEEKDKATEHRLQIGKTVAEAGKDTGERYARADNSDVVVVLPAAISRRLLASALEFRDRELTHLDSVNQLTLERGPRKAVFTKVEETWKMTEPVQSDAEQADFDAFVKNLSRLRADELVAEHPLDLRPYGLDNPQARWRVSAGGKEAHVLQVGDYEKAKAKDGRRYARLTNGAVVFLLSPDVSKEALAEYRDRKVLSSLDAAQVDKIRFGYESSPFVLKKAENKWQIEGKTALKVNEEAVRSTLDAIAKLRAERYVVDKGADLALYGLQPPMLALEMESAGSKQTLQIGHVEGQSERRYATMPGTGAGAVFVISEADSERLVRPMQAFMEKSGKTP